MRPRQGKIIRFSTVFLLMLLIFVAACKKKRAFNEEDAQDTVDVRYTQGECDEVVKDINTVILEQYLLRSKGSAGAGGSSTTSICGATLDTTLITGGVITINYNGQNCFGRTRTGSVRFSILGYPLNRWKQPGCKMNVEYLGYKLLRSSDGKSIQLDGTQTLVNESGNTWYELWFLNEPKLVNLMTGSNLKVTYDNGDYAKFNFNRRLTFTFSNFVTTALVQGTGSADGRDGVENWGENRKGEAFSTQVSSAYTWKTECGAIAPVSGEVIVKVSGKEHELKCFYGVDKDGNSVSGVSNPCPFGWKTTWAYKKKTHNRTFSFY